MNRIQITVRPRTDGTWSVRRSDSPRPCAIMPTSSEAIPIGRDLAQSVSGELVISTELDTIRPKPRTQSRPRAQSASRAKR